MQLIKLINKMSPQDWDSIQTDTCRSSHNIENLYIIRDSILSLNKRINSICNLDSVCESNLNLSAYKCHVTRIDACTTSIDYKLSKDKQGLRSLISSISDITSQPSLPATASKVNVLNGLTEHYVNNVKNYYNAQKINGKLSPTTYNNYSQALETIDHSFTCLWGALLENKKKYLVTPMTSYVNQALFFYTDLVLQSDLEVLKTISQKNFNFTLTSKISEHIEKILPDLQMEIKELKNYQEAKTSSYSNIFRIGYSKEQKLAALNKLDNLIAHKKSDYDTNFSIYKLNEEDKYILKDGKTGRTLDSLAIRYGLLSIGNLLALL
ncbi:hypothetical protein FRA_29c03510 [Francisella sp. W12-1067]|nr:hypothetical protein FRA_29c03510 [Francisella sp. W12-1067]